MCQTNYLLQHIIQPQLRTSAILFQFEESVTASFHLQFHTVTQHFGIRWWGLEKSTMVTIKIHFMHEGRKCLTMLMVLTVDHLAFAFVLYFRSSGRYIRGCSRFSWEEFSDRILNSNAFRLQRTNIFWSFGNFSLCSPSFSYISFFMKNRQS